MKFTIKALRVNKNLTQEQFAKKLGVSVSTIANWENGKTFPDVDQINKMLDILNVGYDNIIFLKKSTV